MINFLETHRAALVGVGLMYLWLTASLLFVPGTQSRSIVINLASFAGAALVSVSAIATFFYINNLELRAEKLKARNEENEKLAKYWQDQSQRAISYLEEERQKSKLVIPATD
jgi:hypothetical protein